MSITSCIREFPGGLPCPTPASPPTSISWPRAPASPQPDSWHRFPDLLNHNKNVRPPASLLSFCVWIFAFSEEELKGSTDLRARVGHPGDITLTISFEIAGIFYLFFAKLHRGSVFANVQVFVVDFFLQILQSVVEDHFLYAILQVVPPVNFFIANCSFEHFLLIVYLQILQFVVPDYFVCRSSVGPGGPLTD